MGVVSAKAYVKKSISVLAVEDTQQGHGNDLHIEGEAPVAQIIEIVLHALRDRGVPPPAIYLRPAGDSDLKRVTNIVFLEPLEMPFYKVGHFRPRADNAHTTPNHVEKLGQFVKI